jgi:hypothetical protein
MISLVSNECSLQDLRHEIWAAMRWTLTLLGLLLPANSPGQPVVRCGLNQTATVDPREVLRNGTASSERGTDRELFSIVTEETRRNHSAMDRGFRVPYVWLTEGGRNVILVRGCKLAEDSPDIDPFTVILADNAWLQDIGRKAGTSWTRTWALAHELGHIYYGHLERGGTTRVPAEELEADYFAGRALARLGASLADAQSFIRVLDPKATDRLTSIKKGWADGAGTRRQDEPRSHDIAVVVAGTMGAGAQVELRVNERTYTLVTGTKARIPVEGRQVALEYRAPAMGRREWTGVTANAGQTYWVHWFNGSVVLSENSPTLAFKPEGWARTRRRLCLN